MSHPADHMHNTLAYLNSTSIAFAPSLFYGICAVETILCIFSLLLAPFAALALMRAGVIHRNFRFCVISAVVQLVIACLSRIVILYWQLFDLPCDDPLLLLASLLRDEFFGYFSSILGAVALERLVATVHTEWYEKEEGTLHVFVIVQAVLILPSLTNAALWTLRLIPDAVNYVFLAVQLVFSASSLLAIYRYNKKLLENAEVQFVDYSVSRAFQLRENIRMMKVREFQMAFFLYGCYIFLPDSFRNIRYLSIALYDAWSAVEQVVITYLLIKRNPAILNKFLQLPIIRAVYRCFSTVRTYEKEYSLDDFDERMDRDTETHFGDLQRAWT